MQLFQNKKLTDSALKFTLLSPKDKKLALAQAICNNLLLVLYSYEYYLWKEKENCTLLF